MSDVAGSGRTYELLSAVSFLGLGILFSANAYYYYGLQDDACHTDTSCNAISKSAATVMFWLNLIAAIICVILFGYTLYLLLTSREQQATVTRSLTTPPALQQWWTGQRGVIPTSIIAGGPQFQAVPTAAQVLTPVP